jgi:hypothetical protein
MALVLVREDKSESYCEGEETMKQEKNRGDIVIYKAEDGQTALEVTLENQTVWLSLNQMAALFLRDKSVISRHLRNVFKEKELLRDSTVPKFATVQKERDFAEWML